VWHRVAMVDVGNKKILTDLLLEIDR
jgi:hypothetical protein